MLGDLSQDLIGTDPKYPKIVNQNWLDVDKETYDNYPSDNNPVRVQPKLSEMWNTDDKGPQVLPNMSVQPLGIRSNNEPTDKTAQISVIKAAKKAMMAGLKGRKISEHLKSLFTPDVLASVQDALKKLASEEMGLLGNVYIDASAFENYNDAEAFIKQHRNRLARDLLYEVDHCDPVVVSTIAQKFRKNVVSSINYDDKFFAHYKEHLVLANQIPENFEINSKESLRQAFLFETEKEPEIKRAATHTAKKLSSEEVSEGLRKISEKKSAETKIAEDQIRLTSIRPVLSFIQESLSKGKGGEFLKDMIRQRFSSEDIEKSSDCIIIAISKKGLDSKHIDSLIKENKLSSIVGDELKKIAKRWPVKKAEIPEYKEDRAPAGVPGYEYALSGRKQSNDKIHKATVIALQRGTEHDKVREMLLKRLSVEDTDRVLLSALNELNSVPSGVVANKPKNTKSAIIVEDPNPPKAKLPPAEGITAELKEHNDWFKGMSTDIDVGSEPENAAPVDIDVGLSRAGIDENLS